MVRFGHDGWSGQLAGEVTVDSVTAVARAAGVTIVRDFPEDARLVVGYDRRFMADTFAGLIARELASLGIEIVLIPRPVPPAAITFAIQQMEAIGGIMVTAGNDHPTRSGIKLRSWDGAALPRWMLDTIEELTVASTTISRIGPTAHVYRHDPMESYLKSIESQVPVRSIRESGITAVIDSHWGVGSELIPWMTDGSGSRSVEIRSAHNPLFPELASLAPDMPNLDRLRRLVRTGDAALGLAISADATVLAALDEQGRPVPPQLLSSIVAWYLLNYTRQRGAVARSISASSSIDKIARSRNVPVHDLPVGRTEACEIIRETSPMLVVDQNGGIALSDHQNEPDAIVAALVLMATLVRTGSELSELVDEIREITGDRQLERTRVELTRDQSERVRSRLERQEWPDDIAGYPVQETYVLDGTRFELDPDAWVLIYHDAEESVLEIVAETTDSGRTAQILSAARQMVFS